MSQPRPTWPESRTAGPERIGTVAVLYGGRSDEREISLASGRAVLEALVPPPQAEDDGRGPTTILGVEIGTDGRWKVGGRSLPPHEALAALREIDVFFLALHGGEGEGGAIQGLLTCANRRFTGSGLGASSLCLDKQASRIAAWAAGVRTAPGVCVDRRAFERERRGLLRRVQGLSPVGWILKARHGGSSVGIQRVLRDEVGGSVDARLSDGIDAILADGDDVLVEACVEGIEVTSAILGNRGEELCSLTPVEIRPHEGRFFDYEEKYSPAGATELCPPESLPAMTNERVRALGLRLHHHLGCDGYSRVDFIVPGDRDSGRFGEPVFLESNTLPGLTPRSLFPLAARTDGLGFRDLCLEILHAALRRDPGPEASQ